MHAQVVEAGKQAAAAALGRPPHDGSAANEAIARVGATCQAHGARLLLP